MLEELTEFPARRIDRTRRYSSRNCHDRLPMRHRHSLYGIAGLGFMHRTCKDSDPTKAHLFNTSVPINSLYQGWLQQGIPARREGFSVESFCGTSRCTIRYRTC